MVNNSLKTVFLLRQLLYSTDIGRYEDDSQDASCSVWVGREFLFETREEAERQMHNLSHQALGDVYCYYIAEIPFGVSTRLTDLTYGSLNCRRYNPQCEEEVRTLCVGLDCGDGSFMADDKEFKGRPADKCPFKKGDTVEVLTGDSVSSYVVQETPFTPSWYQERLARFHKEHLGCDCSDDSYMVSTSLDELWHTHPSVLNVFSPREKR